MNKDRPLAEIAVNELDMCSVVPLESEGKYYPFEMEQCQTSGTFMRFLKERVTPKTRQGLWKSLRECGFSRYSIAAILIASNGRDCSDPYWIRFKIGPQTWKEVWEAIGVYNKP